MELTAAHVALFCVEVGGNGRYTIRITHEDNLVGQLLGFQMKMETRTVGIDDQFGFWKMSFTHRLVLFIC